jgi:hypothetical protein
MEVEVVEYFVRKESHRGILYAKNKILGLMSGCVERIRILNSIGESGILMNTSACAAYYFV